MKPLYKRRFEKIIAFLEKLPAKHFDLDFITHDRDGCTGNELTLKLQQIKQGKKVSCGAVACCVGWFPAIYPQTFEWTNPNLLAEPNVRNKKTDKTNGYAAVEYLNLSNDELGYLFLSENYKNPTKRNIINRIKQFVKTGKINYKKFPDGYVVEPWD